MIAKRYILDEVAAELRVKKRWLADFLRANPCDGYGEPFFRLAGRVKLFTETDIARIYKALPCPSSSCRPVSAKRRTGRVAAPTSDNTLTEALRLASEHSHPRLSANGNAKSNVVSLSSRASRPSPAQR